MRGASDTADHRETGDESSTVDSNTDSPFVACLI